MRTRVIVASLLASTLMAADRPAPEPASEWKSSLKVVLVDEWQRIFGEPQSPPRPKESFARKLVDFNKVVAKSTGGRIVPIYLSPEAAAYECPATPGPEPQPTLFAPLRKCNLLDTLRFLTDTAQMKMRVTDQGILIDVVKEDSKR